MCQRYEYELIGVITGATVARPYDVEGSKSVEGYRNQRGEEDYLTRWQYIDEGFRKWMIGKDEYYSL